MVYLGDKIALEDIMNNSICVKEETGIRKMNRQDDLQADLVFVNNIAPVGMILDVIEAGKMVRYKKISIL